MLIVCVMQMHIKALILEMFFVMPSLTYASLYLYFLIPIISFVTGLGEKNSLWHNFCLQQV